MELSNLKPVERLVNITHPSTGEDLGLKFTLLSLKDDKTSAARRRIQNKKIELEKRGKTFNAKDLEENEFELLQACITGWDWPDGLELHGEKPEYNERNLKTVLDELPWLKDQLKEAISDEKAFFQG